MQPTCANPWATSCHWPASHVAPCSCETCTGSTATSLEGTPMECFTCPARTFGGFHSTMRLAAPALGMDLARLQEEQLSSLTLGSSTRHR
eukprot:2603226-Amphidinium_carterae.1